MKQHLIKTASALAILCSFNLFAITTGTGGLPGDFMDDGSTARAYAMGRSVVAYADDAGAVYYNPACLVLDGDSDIAILNITPMNAELGSQYNFISAKMPMGGFGTVAGGIVRQSIGNITSFDGDFNIISEGQDFSQTGIFGAYAKRLFLLPYRITSVGATLEVMHDSFPLAAQSGGNAGNLSIGADVGVLQEVISGIFLGMNIKHALPPSMNFYTPESYPFIFKFGAAWVPDLSKADTILFLVFGNMIFTFNIDLALHLASYHAGGMALAPTTNLGLEKKFVIPSAVLNEAALRLGASRLGVYPDGKVDGVFTYGVGIKLFDIIKMDWASDLSTLGFFTNIIASVALQFDTHSQGASNQSEKAKRLYLTGKFDEAEHHYQKAHEINPKDPDIYKEINKARHYNPSIKEPLFEQPTKKMARTMDDDMRGKSSRLKVSRDRKTTLDKRDRRITGRRDVKSEWDRDRRFFGKAREERQKQKVEEKVVTKNRSTFMVKVSPNITFSNTDALREFFNEANLLMGGLRAEAVWYLPFLQKHFGISGEYAGDFMKLQGNEAIDISVRRLTASVRGRLCLEKNLLTIGAKAGWHHFDLENRMEKGAYLFRTIYGPSFGVFASDPFFYHVFKRAAFAHWYFEGQLDYLPVMPAATGDDTADGGSATADASIIGTRQAEFPYVIEYYVGSYYQFDFFRVGLGWRSYLINIESVHENYDSIELSLGLEF